MGLKRHLDAFTSAVATQTHGCKVARDARELLQSVAHFSQNASECFTLPTPPNCIFSAFSQSSCCCRDMDTRKMVGLSATRMPPVSYSQDTRQDQKDEGRKSTSLGHEKMLSIVSLRRFTLI
uniref:HDC18412 n=1 Tax=Drosophila melanogaster TaxID=7227 RepID=Q6IIF7_DROME|nr:TPA_inf: HDC18412 [Drosophila melanogaster]